MDINSEIMPGPFRLVCAVWKTERILFILEQILIANEGEFCSGQNILTRMPPAYVISFFNPLYNRFFFAVHLVSFSDTLT